MMVDIFQVAVLVLMEVAGVRGFASGGPTNTCGSLLPGHGSESGANPYSIDIVGDAEYTPGSPVTFRITGDSFQGLMLQARRPGSTSAVGTFTNPPDNIKTMKCRLNDDTLTNSRSFTKADGTLFTWTSSADLGELQFVGTVMKFENVWWRNVKSEILRVKTNDTPKMTSPPIVAGNTTTTTPTSPRVTPSIPSDTSDGDITSADMRLAAFVIVTYVLAIFL